MHPLARRVAIALRFDRLAGPGDRVLVALSGGPDSVALSLLLAEALPSVGAVLAGVAHLHHGLRGPDADRDETFCRSFATGRGLPLFSERRDVAALAREQRLSLETAGHRARRAFYDRAARELDATRVATGHTRNDLAETFLMRALRGAGLRGLAGIRPRQGLVIRPLLDTSRAEVLAYLAERGQTFCEDATNRDSRIARNRIRHEVLPWLEARHGPRVVEALARAGRLAAADEAFLREATAAATGSVPWVVLPNGPGLSIDAGGLAALPRALQRRSVLEAIERVSGRTGSLMSVDRVLRLLEEGPGARRVAAGGVTAGMEGGRLVLAPAERGRGRGASRTTRFQSVPSLPLPVPGEVLLAGGGRVTAQERPRSTWQGLTTANGDRPNEAEPLDAALDASRYTAPLAVRFRRPGDRLQPLGMTGHKKLQDLLVDRRIPRDERDRIPLVVDANDQILWVPGHAVAESARVTPATTSVLLLLYWRQVRQEA